MSDLDDDELRATRILNGVEKTADKMFEELGYEITEENNSKNKYDNGIQFMKKERSVKKYIEFYYYHKQIVIYTDQYIYEKIKRWESTIINMQELKAINKKCEELGWKE